MGLYTCDYLFSWRGFYPYMGWAYNYLYPSTTLLRLRGFYPYNYLVSEALALHGVIVQLLRRFRGSIHTWGEDTTTTSSHKGYFLHGGDHTTASSPIRVLSLHGWGYNYLFSDTRSFPLGGHETSLQILVSPIHKCNHASSNSKVGCSEPII